jgi:hypothetical protein
VIDFVHNGKSQIHFSYLMLTMSETRIFGTETRSRWEIKQFFDQLVWIGNKSMDVFQKFSNWRANIFTLQEERDRERERRAGRLSSKCWSHQNMPGNTAVPWKTASNIILKSCLSSRENFLHLVSHEKFYFSRETRTRRDLAHGYLIYLEAHLLIIIST